MTPLPKATVTDEGRGRADAGAKATGVALVTRLRRPGSVINVRGVCGAAHVPLRAGTRKASRDTFRSVGFRSRDVVLRRHSSGAFTQFSRLFLVISVISVVCGPAAGGRRVRSHDFSGRNSREEVTDMEIQQDVYEAPMVSEAGDFAEVTLGWPLGHMHDGGLPPFWRFPSR
ncbi:lasso RiPP family leader peptide-containing protein [Streptomyces sp. URMC 123]|uniref:lasso RiPP family leader peptide-containing protein n=1 Tax=Streptomyces sp. URMC 123 TaxID=3423403 RepID=UPI003F1C554C